MLTGNTLPVILALVKSEEDRFVRWENERVWEFEKNFVAQKTLKLVSVLRKISCKPRNSKF